MDMSINMSSHLWFDITAYSQCTSLLGHVESEADHTPHMQQLLLSKPPCVLHSGSRQYHLMQQNQGWERGSPSTALLITISS